MEIRTKFNVGDTIWYIEDVLNGKDYIDCFIVGKIMACYNDDDDNKLNITYARKNSFHFIFEQDCFATKEQAQKECDRRNGTI